MTALLSFLTSCRIETFEKNDASTDVATASQSNTESEVTSVLSAPDDHRSLLLDELVAQVEDYMAVLHSGDIEATCEKFKLEKNSLFPNTYECDEEIYRVLHTNMTYSYGSVLKEDEQDYDLEVLCNIPDLASCVSLVFSDEEYMVGASEAWVLALCEGDNDQVNETYKQMLENVITEALRRIDEGEYTESVTYNDYFSLHDNINNWNVLKFPDFITFMNQNQFMNNIAYRDINQSYELFCRVGSRLVEDGKLEQKVLEQKMEQLQILIDEN